MSSEQIDELGPIDYVVIEWPGRQPGGEAAPALVELVDRGVIRVLDLAFITKGEDGEVTAVDFDEVADQVPDLKLLDGASSGLLVGDDLAAAGDAMDPGTSAALLVYENRWAAPFASAVRRSGGQLIADGRIPVQSMLAALDAAEEKTA